MKVRVLRQRLAHLGCAPARCRGSHETWYTPGGRPLTIVVNHLNHEASRLVLSHVRRVLRQEGLSL